MGFVLKILKKKKKEEKARFEPLWRWMKTKKQRRGRKIGQCIGVDLRYLLRNSPML
jgi:hypothetical protein